MTSYGGFQGFGPDLGEWLGAAHFSFFSPKKRLLKFGCCYLWILMIFNEILCIFANFGRIWAFEGGPWGPWGAQGGPGGPRGPMGGPR